MNLWLCCTVIAVLVFCTPDLIHYATGHLSLDKLRVFFTFNMAGSMLVGLAAQLALTRAGFRLSRRLADQAADYDDKPGAP